jgi:hypothetical protein
VRLFARHNSPAYDVIVGRWLFRWSYLNRVYAQRLFCLPDGIDHKPANRGNRIGASRLPSEP